jgi:hypothetical protein
VRRGEQSHLGRRSCPTLFEENAAAISFAERVWDARQPAQSGWNCSWLDLGRVGVFRGDAIAVDGLLMGCEERATAEESNGAPRYRFGFSPSQMFSLWQCSAPAPAL